MRPSQSKDVESFLAKAPAVQRAALKTLRAAIKAAAPETEEVISYGVPMFKYRGHPLVSYGYGKEHCSFFVQSPAVMKAHAKPLTSYEPSKGTVHFTPDKPIPATLIKKLVEARIKETEERFGYQEAKSVSYNCG